MRTIIISCAVLLLLCCPSLGGDTSYTYDALNRLVRVDYGIGAGYHVAYEYDDAGNIKTITKTGIDLSDVILALKIAAGIEPVETVNATNEFTGDNKIGVEDALYALQVIAESRP